MLPEELPGINYINGEGLRSTGSVLLAQSGGTISQSSGEDQPRRNGCRGQAGAGYELSDCPPPH